MQRTNFGEEYSSWKEIKYYFPQASVLCLIFSNINLSDLSFIIKDAEIVYKLKIPLSNLKIISN